MFGVEILENAFLNAEFNDIIVLIKKNFISIFIGDKQGYNLLKQLLVGIPNIEIFCPNIQQQENKDECELLKLAQFYKMMKGVQKVGVMLGQKDKQKIKQIEKWPLIQSYGLNEIGVGFFSLNHQPVDLTERIQKVFKNHDKFSLAKIIYDTANRITGHFLASAGVISNFAQHNRIKINESQLNEILTDSYELEQVSQNVKEDEELPRPRVLFGNRTAIKDVKEVGSSEKSISTQSYKYGFDCFHMTIETVDLYTKVRTARTYFLGKNQKYRLNIENVMDDNVLKGYKFVKKLNENFDSENYLLNMYLIITKSFQEILQAFAKDYRNLTNQFVQQFIFQQILIQDPQFKIDQIKIDIKSYNAFGETVPIDFKDAISFKLTPVIYLLRIEAQDLTKDGTFLGNVLFAETFILQEGCFLLLTKNVPFLDIFNVEWKNSDQVQNLKKLYVTEELGLQYNQWDKLRNFTDLYENNRIFVPTDQLSQYGIDIPVLKGKYIYHEKGLRIWDDKLGWFIIFFSEMKNIRFTRNLSPMWMVFMLDENIVFQGLEKQILCLEFQGRSQQEVLFKIKDYFDVNQIEYEWFDEIPQFFENSVIGRKEILNRAQDQLIINNHIQSETFFLQYLLSKQLLILNQMKDLKLSTFKTIYEQIVQEKNQDKEYTEKIGIIFINGSHNQGKRKFAENLTRYAKDFRLNLHLLSFEITQYPILDEKIFIQSLINLARETQGKGSIIIAAVPAFISTKFLIEEITKNEKLSKIFYIRMIATKLNLNNIYNNQNYGIHSGIFCYGIEGYSQMILVDKYENLDEDVNKVVNLINKSIPQQNIFRILNNICHQSIAKSILCQSKFQNELNNFNRAKYSVLYDIQYSLSLKSTFIPFKNPLIFKLVQDIALKRIMKNQSGYTYEEQEIYNLMKQIKEENKNSKDELMIEIIKLKEKIERINLSLRNDQMHLFYIKGVCRFEEDLKEGFYELTINSNYIQKKKLNNIKTKVKSETINGQKIDLAYYQKDSDFRQENIGFLFVGQNLDQQKIEKILQTLIGYTEDVPEIYKKEFLTEVEIKQIQQKNIDRDLESGFFYDGCHIRDEDGLIVSIHPKS